MKFTPLLLLLAASSSALFAQELPRPSLAREENSTKALPTDYNMKVGPVLFNVNASMETDYVDNISLNSSDKLSDVTLNPQLGLSGRWPVTESNTLELTTSLGYTKYLLHPRFDTSNVLVAPDSKLSFDVYTGNFKINFHDVFAFEQDPVQEAALTNVVNFDRFTNDAGITVLWDLNKVVLSASYDHINFIATDIQSTSGAFVNDPGTLNYAADQVSASAEVHVSSTLLGGLEGTASTREYDQESGTYYQYTFGPYMKMQVTEHIKAELSGGYQYIATPSNTASPLPTDLGPGSIISTGQLTPQMGQGSDSSYYVDLSLDQQVNSHFIHRGSVGHNIDLGLLGEESDVTYADYSASWHVNKSLNLALNLSFQDVTQNGGLVHVAPYDTGSVGLQASFPVTKSISGSMIFQYTDKFGSSDNVGYTQTRVGLILTYHF